MFEVEEETLEWADLRGWWLPVKRFSPSARIPTRAHDTDAGLDLYADEGVYLEPLCYALIDTGIGVELLPNTYGQILGRSSLAMKWVFTIGGVIDAGYRGPLKVGLANMGNERLCITRGMKIAQLVVIRIDLPHPTEVTELGDAERGEKGFGSSGQ